MSSSPAPAKRYGFPFVLASSALIIAGCSAYFSVRGLGLLFSSEIPVMIMASALEIGKLVAASFLYRYWAAISASLKFYLTLALLVLIGITSLGNYGYLARAYEKTNDAITIAESQIAAFEREVSDLDARLEAARVSTTRNRGDNREDVVKAQARITAEKDALAQAVSRLEAARVSANEARAADAKAAAERSGAQADIFRKTIAADEATVANLLKRQEVLDRAVDAYTQQGTTGVLIFQTDGVRLGQELRAQQAPERASISAELEKTRARIEQVRSDLGKQTGDSAKELRAIEDRFREESRRLDGEIAEARKISQVAISELEKQLASVETRLAGAANVDEGKLESLNELRRTRMTEIQALKDSIANSDIGTYRFVARAFDTTADVVVKWLIIAIVLVFDPLAVVLTIGFNVALLRDTGAASGFAPIGAGFGSASPAAAGSPSAPATAARGWVFGALTTLVVVLVALLAWVLWPSNTRILTSGARDHLRLVPGDSFAVMTFRPFVPAVDPKSPAPAAPQVADPVLQAFLERLGGPVALRAIQDLATSGLDTRAEVVAFAKHPTRPPGEDGDRPVVVCGLIVRITDPDAAEASLARLADQMRTVLRGNSGKPASLTRNRAMIRHAGGRFLDPERGFFSFGLTDSAAILLVEFDGDPAAPCVENEMRRCLALASGQDQSQESLPRSAFGAVTGVSLWADAERFFRRLPMSEQTEERYAEIRPAIDFELGITLRLVGADQVNLEARYDYRQGRPEKLALANDDSLLGAVTEDDSARLLRRAAETLELDALAERFRAALGVAENLGINQVLVEKSQTSSTRSAQFTVTARLEKQSDQPLAGVLLALMR
jgi:predicted  nucleic acid-binding Zn-ribbon protein